MPRPSKHAVPFLLPFLFFLASGCEKEQMGDCLKSHGKRMSETRKLERVRAIEVHDHIRVRIEEGNEESVEITAGENLLPLIESKMEGDTLVLRDRNTCNWVRSYEPRIEAQIEVKELLALEQHGTAEIESEDTLHSPRFRFEQWNGMGDVELLLHSDTAILKLHTGAGDLTCRGRSEHASLFAGGSGFMYLEELRCQDVWAHSDASGNIHLNAEEELRVLIESIGSVFYKGGPDIEQYKKEGSGKLEAL